MISTEGLLSLQGELIDLQQKHDTMFERLILQSGEMSEAEEREVEEQKIETTLRVQMRVVGKRINSLEKYLQFEEEDDKESDSEDSEQTGSESSSGDSDSDSTDEDEDSSDELEDQSKQTELVSLTEELERSKKKGQQLAMENKHLTEELDKRTSKLFDYIAKYPQFVSQKTFEDFHVDVSNDQIQIEQLEEEVSELKKLLSTLMNELIYLSDRVKKQKRLVQDKDMSSKIQETEQGNDMKRTEQEARPYCGLLYEPRDDFDSNMERYEPDLATRNDLPITFECRDLQNETEMETRVTEEETAIEMKLEVLRRRLQSFKSGHESLAQRETEHEALQLDDYVYVQDELEDDKVEVEEVPTAEEAEQGVETCIEELAQWGEASEADGETLILVENRSRNGREAAEFFMFIGAFVFIFPITNSLLSLFM